MKEKFPEGGHRSEQPKILIWRDLKLQDEGGKLDASWEEADRTVESFEFKGGEDHIRRFEISFKNMDAYTLAFKGGEMALNAGLQGIPPSFIAVDNNQDFEPGSKIHEAKVGSNWLWVTKDAARTRGRPAYLSTNRSTGSGLDGTCFQSLTIPTSYSAYDFGRTEQTRELDPCFKLERIVSTYPDLAHQLVNSAWFVWITPEGPKCIHGFIFLEPNINKVEILDFGKIRVGFSCGEKFTVSGSKGFSAIIAKLILEKAKKTSTGWLPWVDEENSGRPAPSKILDHHYKRIGKRFLDIKRAGQTIEKIRVKPPVRLTETQITRLTKLVQSFPEEP